MSSPQILVNRAPVLTLWAAVVAERLGHGKALSLTLGHAVAGLNAQSKGRRLGIYEEPEEDGKGLKKKPEPAGEIVHLMGRAVPVVETPNGRRAAVDGRPDDPAYVERYLIRKFGESLQTITEAMEALARSRTPHALEHDAFALYEEFRPAIPEGVRGWGTKGELSLEKLLALAEAH